MLDSTNNGGANPFDALPDNSGDFIAPWKKGTSYVPFHEIVVGGQYATEPVGRADREIGTVVSKNTPTSIEIRIDSTGETINVTQNSVFLVRPLDEEVSSKVESIISPDLKEGYTYVLFPSGKVFTVIVEGKGVQSDYATIRFHGDTTSQTVNIAELGTYNSIANKFDIPQVQEKILLSSMMYYDGTGKAVFVKRIVNDFGAGTRSKKVGFEVVPANQQGRPIEHTDSYFVSQLYSDAERATSVPYFDVTPLFLGRYSDESGKRVYILTQDGDNLTVLYPGMTYENGDIGVTGELTIKNKL